MTLVCVGRAPFVAATFVILGIATAAPAFAQNTAPPPAITSSGSIALVSDYRFRGVSQSDEELAIQGGVTVAHEGGFYVSVWAFNLAGWGTFGGSDTELDLIGGYKRSLGRGFTADVGLTWYMYPGGASSTDFAEPYAKLSGTLGPVTAVAGIAYAPKQRALGNFSNTPFSRGQAADNFYVWGDVGAGVAGSPLTAKAHLGYSNGNPGLGPNGASVAPTGFYIDYLVGLDLSLKPITLGIAFTGTDISRAKAAYLQPNFSSTKDGSSISSGGLVFAVSAAF